MRGYLDQSEDIVNLGRQSNRSPRQEFIEQNLDGVEPVEAPRRGAERNAFIVIAFTEVPESDLVEIVEAEGACEGVNEHKVFAGRGGDDVCEVEFKEICMADSNFVVNATYFDLSIRLVIILFGSRGGHERELKISH